MEPGSLGPGGVNEGHDRRGSQERRPPALPPRLGAPAALAPGPADLLSTTGSCPGGGGRGGGPRAGGGRGAVGHKAQGEPRSEPLTRLRWGRREPGGRRGASRGRSPAGAARGVSSAAHSRAAGRCAKEKEGSLSRAACAGPARRRGPPARLAIHQGRGPRTPLAPTSCRLSGDGTKTGPNPRSRASSWGPPANFKLKAKPPNDHRIGPPPLRPKWRGPRARAWGLGLRRVDDPSAETPSGPLGAGPGPPTQVGRLDQRWTAGKGRSVDPLAKRRTRPHPSGSTNSTPFTSACRATGSHQLKGKPPEPLYFKTLRDWTKGPSLIWRFPDPSALPRRFS